MDPHTEILTEADAPSYPALSSSAAAALDPATPGYRKVDIPAHRLTPLKREWASLHKPLVDHLKLSVRVNPKRRCVEIKTTKATPEPGCIQKAADYVRAFMLGFDIADAVALLRMDDLYLDSFEIKDVKTLHGDHLARAIGRIAGRDGKTKYAIENSTRTRIVLAETHIHILGSFQNIRLARNAVVDLILGAPANKVYGKLQTIQSRVMTKY
jgi:RNA-binding protein PNO1